MDGKMENITILSDQNVRATIIQNLILDGLEHQVTVSVIGSNQFQGNIQKYDNCIILADLISVEKPASHLLHEIRQSFPQVKIIALHIYRSMVLVQPLFEMGINGYIYYEPTRKELVRAINSVSSGSVYKPEFLLHT
jgi:DNA-binding NarL/FixJ family response regulator